MPALKTAHDYKNWYANAANQYWVRDEIGNARALPRKVFVPVTYQLTHGLDIPVLVIAMTDYQAAWDEFHRVLNEYAPGQVIVAIVPPSQVHTIENGVHDLADVFDDE